MLGAEWEDGPFFGSLCFIMVVVVMGIGANPTGMTNGQSSGITMYHAWSPLGTIHHPCQVQGDDTSPHLKWCPEALDDSHVDI